MMHYTLIFILFCKQLSETSIKIVWFPTIIIISYYSISIFCSDFLSETFQLIL
jgi:hypothetical protein